MIDSPGSKVEMIKNASAGEVFSFEVKKVGNLSFRTKMQLCIEFK